VAPQTDEPLGDILAKALDRQEQIREAVKPQTPPSLRELAKNDLADAYVAARRRDIRR
jgi:hypothetical protein